MPAAVLLSLFFCCQAACAGGAARPIGLSEAVEIAMENNPEISALAARREALSNVPSQAGSLPDPVLSLGALNLPTDSFSLEQEPMTQVQVKLSQAIPFPGKLSLKKRSAQEEVRALGYRVQELRIRIASRVKAAWWEVFYLEKALEIVERNKKELQEMVKVARKRYEVGKGLQQDVLLAQVELADLFNMEAELQGRLRSQKAALIRLLGKRDMQDLTVPLSAEITVPPPPKIRKVLKEAEDSRPLIKAYREEIRAAEDRLALAKKGYLPDFNLGAAYGFRQGSNPQGKERPDFASFMVSMNIPLWARSKQSREISQKGLELSEKKELYRNALQLVREEIESARSDYEKSFRQASFFRSAVIPQARQTLSSMLSAYQVGRVDFLNVIRARLALLKYERRYWRALTGVKKAEARLEAATGTLGVPGNRPHMNEAEDEGS